MPRWYSFPCSIQEVNLRITLVCGQSFRWRENDPGAWTSILDGKLWTLRQDDDTLYYAVTEPDDVSAAPSTTTHLEAGDMPVAPRITNHLEAGDVSATSATTHLSQNRKKKNLGTGDVSATKIASYEATVQDYLQLDRANLADLYKRWGSEDENFRRVAADFGGVRILRQDPVENLFSFICSSNNNITRISSMVEKLCSEYGKKLVCDGTTTEYYSFPSIAALAGEGVEDRLRELGFGYRAKYIAGTASYILRNHSESWLYSLRDRPYGEARAELMKLCGVGPKVADCVCLMSLGKTGAIPVDTHVWQIAAATYMPQLRTKKSLTDSTYQEIGDFFRKLWGDYAGWAHSVLFSADLKKFKESKPLVSGGKETGKSRKRKSNVTVASGKQCAWKKN